MKERYNRIKDALEVRRKILGRKGFMSVYDKIMRKLSLIFVFLFSFTPLTGNQVSMIGILFVILALT